MTGVSPKKCWRATPAIWTANCECCVAEKESMKNERRPVVQVPIREANQVRFEVLCLTAQHINVDDWNDPELAAIITS